MNKKHYAILQCVFTIYVLSMGSGYLGMWWCHDMSRLLNIDPPRPQHYTIFPNIIRGKHKGKRVNDKTVSNAVVLVSYQLFTTAYSSLIE